MTSSHPNSHEPCLNSPGLPVSPCRSDAGENVRDCQAKFRDDVGHVNHVALADRSNLSIRANDVDAPMDRIDKHDDAHAVADELAAPIELRTDRLPR